MLFEYIAERMRLPSLPEVELSTRYVVSNNRNVLLRIERQQGSGPQPCLVYMHGGAWMQGSPMTHTDITSRIAASNGQTVISVDYALAPEHQFPTAIHEVMDVVRWVHANASELGIDSSRVAIGGDSAGANLAAAACIGLRDNDKDHLPMAQLLFYPCVDLDMARPSYVENADAPLLKTKGMPSINAMYCPEESERRNPLLAPFHAESHTGLPPAFIGVAQYDPLRDDGYDYAEKLRAADVSVKFDAGEGLIHGYLRAMEYCDSSRQRLADACAWLVRCYEHS